jgi:prolyl-tRNA synthetase
MSEQEGLLYKKEDFSEWFSEVIAKTDLADIRYNAKGFIVFRPWAVMAMKKMYRLYEQELEKTGHQPVLFPSLIPESNFKLEAHHVEGFAPEVFWVTEYGAGEKFGERLALRPTSETAMYRMYALWVRGWRDLPLKIYQSCQVWRHDTSATRPFIRSREFHWIETHDVFATREEAEAQVAEDMATTEKVMHLIFGIPFLPLRRPEWDKFPGAIHTFVADTLMPDGKALQQPSTHLLGQNFAKVFGIKFKTREETEEFAWQTCYGPAISRMMASIIALHGDDKGLMFPFEIAPLQVVIVPITTKKEVEEKCFGLKKELEEAGLSAQVDNSDRMPGWKFNEWELKGVPIRLEVGPRELKAGEVTLVRRDNGEKKTVKEEKLADSILAEGKSLSKNLLRKADESFKGKIHDAASLEELSEKLDVGGFVRVDLCTVDMPGKACEDRIKEACAGGKVRGVRADREEKPAGGCIACGKPAACKAYVARQY